jgi:hypothetical protein
MKPTSLLLAGILSAIVVAFIAGLWIGLRKGSFSAALEENKIAALCLRADDMDLDPTFREYLKGRIYYNLATKFPNDRGYLLKEDWDFGPVDTGALRRRLYAKDPSIASESYAADTQHLSNAADSP